MSLPSTVTIQPSHSYTISASPVQNAGLNQSSRWFMPSGKLLIDQFSLVNPGGYADIYKSKTSILCNDGLTRHLGLKVFRVADNSRRLKQIISVINDLVNQYLVMDLHHHNICPIEIVDVTAAFYAIVMPCEQINSGHRHRNRTEVSPFRWFNSWQPLPSRHPFSQVLFLTLRHLKENILVTDCGRACLTDVGINILAVWGFCDGFNPVPSAWSYKAPEELLLGTRDKRSNVYSLACTIYALYIANPPFQSLRYPHLHGLVRMIDIGHLQLIKPPVGICEDLWCLLNACWDKDPAGCPTMVQVERQL
ncbi:hypothetical protein PILCRDRAFT_5422 [Piloderma croceum F 1598]|uniref:Protein kinase domain-containing protein n=1 Tax=Piloderma croceum (strain F 1598) TaxID=765440 RepID=A0A0C3G563_PILCF|nr:hypothetical protein PILCRDRAFT_5422 [Piloderma croceum F 1598]